MNNIINPVLYSVIKKYITNIVPKPFHDNLECIINGSILYMIVQRTATYYVDLSNDIELNNDFCVSFIVKTNTSVEKTIDKNGKEKNSNVINYEFILNANNLVLVSEYYNLIQDDKYLNLLKMKSEEGMKFYIMNNKYGGNIYVPVFKGFPTINAKDTLDINVFSKIDDNNYYYVKYIIHKASIKKDYYLFYRIINLER